MGSMRVLFSTDGYEILFEENHLNAISVVEHPLCKIEVCRELRN